MKNCNIFLMDFCRTHGFVVTLTWIWEKVGKVFLWNFSVLFQRKNHSRFFGPQWYFLIHSVKKSPKTSGNTLWPPALKLTIFGLFKLTQYVNIARFARKVEGDFFGNFPNTVSFILVILNFDEFVGLFWLPLQFHALSSLTWDDVVACFCSGKNTLIYDKCQPPPLKTWYYAPNKFC